MFLTSLPSSVREYLIELRPTCLRGGTEENDRLGLSRHSSVTQTLPDFARGCRQVATNEKLIHHNELQVGGLFAQFSDC